MKKDGHDVASLLVFLDKHLPDVCDQFGIVDFLMDKIPDVVGSEANQVIENYIFQNGEFMLGEQTPKNCVTIIYEHQKKIYSYGVLMTTSSLKNDKKTISFKDEDFVRPPPKPHELFNMASELLHTFDSCNISLIEITRPRTVFILASVFKKIGPQMDLIRGARAFEIFKLDMGIPWKNYATKVDKMDVDDDIKKFFKKFVELASDKRKKVWFEEMVNHIFPKEQENDDDDEEEEEDNQPSYFSMPSEIVNKKRPFQSDSTQQTKKQK
ncbi:hypothetical protein C9374_007310 [Naegleria lovaniensis]|uniref:Uncharacterized protein n=1 Tax=Naegleria lovaniensis TaxID=51637 RepID=A0AA88H030_NAELO|nr:uncharacterized protein C9374_007310 [Naegleria lovaniensis]KAG2393779.1 hypothetical protein C9374_007310 [Naegleria lovaniensis]